MSVKIEFEFETKYGVYRDALYLPDDHTYTQDEIYAMELQRVNDWIAFIENPPAPEPDPEPVDAAGA